MLHTFELLPGRAISFLIFRKEVEEDKEKEKQFL